MGEFFRRLPGPAVLVAGCGEGRDSRHLQGLGARVVSFDLSEGMLSLARAADPAGSYLRADLRDAGSIGGSFDGIWACASLVHLPTSDMLDVLGQLGMLLRPGGKLFVSVMSSGRTG